MFQKILHFIKYNNLTVLLILAVFMAGAGVFAQTPTGEELIGIQEKKVEGIDNTLLMSADLDNFKMDFKIEKIEEDAKYYYVTYTYLDLVKDANAWQYSIQEKIKKVSKKVRVDLGLYLANEFNEEYQAKIKDLKAEKAKAEEVGSEVRTEVVSYTGLVGQVLDLAGAVFPGYEPVKKNEIPSPTIPPTILQLQLDSTSGDSVADDLTQIYQDYIANNNIATVPDVATTTEQIPIDTSTTTEPVETPAEETTTDTTTNTTSEGETEATETNTSDQPSEPVDVQIIELPN